MRTDWPIHEHWDFVDVFNLISKVFTLFASSNPNVGFCFARRHLNQNVEGKKRQQCMDTVCVVSGEVILLDYLTDFRIRPTFMILTAR